MLEKKGIQLTINTMIIIVISLIVLVAAVAMFTSTFSPSAKSINCQADFQNKCGEFVSLGGCKDPPGVTVDGVPGLKEVAEKCLGITDSDPDALNEKIKNKCCYNK